MGDPTNSLYGGGSLKLGDANWTTEGLRILLQAKPTVGDGPLVGPRVQFAYESRGLRVENIPKYACFQMWVGDADTGEVADVEVNDGHEKLPAPVASGVFCYNASVVLGA